MKNNSIKYLLRLTAILAILQYSAQGQTIYRIENTKDIDMKLSGTSTLHKWAMNAKTFTGEAQFIFDTTRKQQLNSLKALTFSLEAEDLKSDEKVLNKNAYKALKTDEFKDIYYKLVTSKVVRNTENRYVVKTHGNLCIAGVTRAIVMDVYCIVNKDSTISCTGSEKLKMSDYQVEPPSFMLGAMKTGDAITLDFILIYKKEKITD